MTRLYSRILIGLFILSGNILVAQDEVCICASYSSLHNKTDYEETFPHTSIKDQKIKEVVVYTEAHTTSDTSLELLPRKYIEIKFHFDPNGYVSSRVQYYRGKPSVKFAFERNTLGQVTKQTFTYIDSLEQNSKYSPPQIIDYFYDSHNRLVKEKSRDYQGNIIDDQVADYSTYEYDVKGRLIFVKGQNYISPTEIYESSKSYEYSNDYQMSICISFYKGEMISTDTLLYDKNGKLSSEVDFNNRLNTVAFYKKYMYDALGNLTMYEIIAQAGGGSECPDHGTYTDRYFYNDKGLVERITNSYGDYTCGMRFEYLK